MTDADPSGEKIAPEIDPQQQAALTICDRWMNASNHRMPRIQRENGTTTRTCSFTISSETAYYARATLYTLNIIKGPKGEVYQLTMSEGPRSITYTFRKPASEEATLMPEQLEANANFASAVMAAEDRLNPQPHQPKPDIETKPKQSTQPEQYPPLDITPEQKAALAIVEAWLEGTPEEKPGYKSKRIDLPDGTYMSVSSFQSRNGYTEYRIWESRDPHMKTADGTPINHAKYSAFQTGTLYSVDSILRSNETFAQKVMALNAELKPQAVAAARKPARSLFERLFGGKKT